MTFKINLTKKILLSQQSLIKILQAVNLIDDNSVKITDLTFYLEKNKQLW